MKIEGGGEMAAVLREIKATIRTGGVLSFAEFGHLAIGITGIVLLSRLGPNELAGGSLVRSVYLPAILFGTGVLYSLSPLLASAIGAAHHERMAGIVQGGMLIALFLSIMTIATLLSIKPILSGGGQDPAVIPVAASYAMGLAPGAVAAFLLVVLRTCVVVTGREAVMPWATLAGVAMNAVVALGLMHGTFANAPLGALGIGLANSAANVGMALILLWSLTHGTTRSLTRSWAPVRIDFSVIGHLLRLGLPIGTVIFIEATMISGSSFMVGWNGVEALAGHGVVSQWFTAALMLPVGLAQAGTVRISLAIGRRSRTGAKSAVTAVLSLTVLAGLIQTALMILWSTDLVVLVLGSGDPENGGIRAQAVLLMPAAAVAQFFSALVIVLAGVARAFRDARFSLLVVVVCYWIVGLGSGAVLVFTLGLGPLGAWIGMAFGFACAVVALCVRVHHCMRAVDLYMDDIHQWDGLSKTTADRKAPSPMQQGGP